MASRRDFTNNLKTASQTGMEKSMENHPTYEDNCLWDSSFGKTSAMFEHYCKGIVDTGLISISFSIIPIDSTATCSKPRIRKMFLVHRSPSFFSTLLLSCFFLFLSPHSLFFFCFSLPPPLPLFFFFIIIFFFS